jgi:hypothetical protein
MSLKRADEEQDVFVEDATWRAGGLVPHPTSASSLPSRQSAVEAGARTSIGQAGIAESIGGQKQDVGQPGIGAF